MITMARIDDRLIHGQIAVKWCKQLEVSRIIVASDIVATNHLQVSALKMAAPNGVKAAILTTARAAEVLGDSRSKDMRILLISNEPIELLKVFELISERPVLNVANYGRINGPIGGKQKISDSVYLTKADIEAVKKIHDLGIEVIHQPLPSDTRKDLFQLIG